MKFHIEELETQLKKLYAEGKTKGAEDLQAKAMGGTAGDPGKAKADNFRL